MMIVTKRQEMVFFFFINLINVGKRERERESIIPNIIK